MPHLLNPNPARSVPISILDSFHYKYTNGLNLRPDSTLHQRLVALLIERANASRDVLSNKFEMWNKIDKKLTVFIPLDQKELDLQEADVRKPVSTVVPISFATLEVLLTYMVEALAVDPIFRYEGVGPEDVIGAALLQQIVNVQMARSGGALAIYTMLRDELTYGFGAMVPTWTKRLGFRRVAKQRSFLSTLRGKILSLPGLAEAREEYVQFEGNELTPIDPYMYLPDPSVPINDVQKGEYVGWIVRDNLMRMLAEERTDDSMFNVQYLKSFDGKSVLFLDQSARDKDSVRSVGEGFGNTRAVDNIYMCVNLIPAEWGIGNRVYPEKWSFRLSGDAIITHMAPLNLDHNMFPVVVCAPNFDGHGNTPVSMLEYVQGMHEFIDFLYNAMVANQRKSIHDMFVVDPERVNLLDVMNPGPGKLIRLRKKAWGHGIKDAIEQLKVSDVTAGNIDESVKLMALIDQMTGAEDTVRGNLRSSSADISATEFQGSQGAALSRLEKHAKIAGMQALTPLAHMVASQTQQFMEMDTYVKIIGDYEQVLAGEYGDVSRVPVSPFDLLINYDVTPSDGSHPRAGDARGWLSMMQMVLSQPELWTKFNVVGMFSRWARMNGENDIQQFILNPNGVQQKVLPDEELEREVQKGNLIPAEGAA